MGNSRLNSSPKEIETYSMIRVFWGAYDQGYIYNLKWICFHSVYTEFMAGAPEWGILGLTEYLFTDFSRRKKNKEYRSRI